MTSQEKNRIKFNEYIDEKAKKIENQEKIKFINLKKFIRPVLRTILKLQRKVNHQTVEIIQYTEKPDNKQVVFVVSHIGKWDFEIVNEQIRDHFYVIASDFINMNGTIGGIFMKANGVVFVDVDNKEDRKNSLKFLKQVIEQGDNVMIFPEGTWNLDENHIINDIHFGAVDIALEKQAIIIPIAIEQFGKRFVINMGNVYNPTEIKEQFTNISYKQLEDNCQLKDKIKLTANTILRDQLATLKYEIWEREGVYERSEISPGYWQDFIEQRKKEWPGYSMTEQYRNGCFPKEKKNYIDMINQLQNMKIRENNEFLFMNQEDFIKKYTKK